MICSPTPHRFTGEEQECAGGVKLQLLRTVLGSTRSRMYVVSNDVTTPTITAIPIPKAMRPVRRTHPVWHSGFGPAAADPVIWDGRPLNHRWEIQLGCVHKSGVTWPQVDLHVEGALNC